MFTSIKLSFVMILNFIYLSIFKLKKIENLPERERTLEARRVIKKLSEKLIKLAKIELEVRYLDYDAYKSIKTEKGIVVIANHQSNFDIPVILSALDIPVGFVAKKEMKNWLFYSTWMRLSKCVFLDRVNHREGIKNMKETIRNIEDGYNMVIFPEGERSLDGEVGEFKKGSFKIVKETKTILLPLSIDGTFSIQKRGEKMIHPNKRVRLTVGKPIEIDKLSNDELDKINLTVSNLIKKEKNIKK